MSEAPSVEFLQTKIKLLQQENDALREALAGMPPRVNLLDDGVAEIKHWAVKYIAVSFADTLKALPAENYVTMDIGTEVGPVSVTLQYKHKKSPADIQAELQQEIDRLKAKLGEAK